MAFISIEKETPFSKKTLTPFYVATCFYQSIKLFPQRNVYYSCCDISTGFTFILFYTVECSLIVLDDIYKDPNSIMILQFIFPQ